MKTVLEKTVSSFEKKMSLIQFLRKHLDKRSGKSLCRLIDAGYCKVGGEIEVYRSHTLAVGEKVILKEPDSLHLVPYSFRDIGILYEDEFFIAVTKPPFVESIAHPFERRFPDQELYLVHRLDKLTSGMMLLAKSIEMKKALEDLFFKREIKKRYLALVDGPIKRDKGRSDNYLFVKKRIAGQTIYGSSERGKRAITDWKREKVSKNASLVLCEPITGRTHQLRVHLKEMGHPIIGDYLYNKHFACSFKSRRLLLHAKEIEFIHPMTKEKMHIKAPLYDDFIEAEKKLGLK